MINVLREIYTDVEKDGDNFIINEAHYIEWYKNQTLLYNIIHINECLVLDYRWYIVNARSEKALLSIVNNIMIHDKRVVEKLNESPYYTDDIREVVSKWKMN